MPLFHFHLEDGRRVLDGEGAEFADLETAKGEATRYMAELMREHPAEPWREGSFRVVITNADGAVLAALTVISSSGTAEVHPDEGVAKS